MKRLLRAWHSLITVLLIGSLVTLQGCSSHTYNIPPVPPSEDVRKQLGVIRVAPIEIKPEELASVYEKKKEQPSGGSGVAGALAILASGGIMGVMIAGGVAVVLLAGIGVYELMKDTTASAGEKEVVEAIHKTLEQASIQHTLVEDIVHNARESTGQHLFGPNDKAQVAANSILKIDRLEFGLLDLGGYHKQLTSYAVLQLRVVEPAEERTLYSAQVKHLGRTMSPHLWGANDAQQLRSEFDLVSQQLAEKIVDTLFLRYPVNQQKLDSSYVYVDSLQPVLRWDAFPNITSNAPGGEEIASQIRDVTYDLKVWETGVVIGSDIFAEPSKPWYFFVPGSELIYSQTGLTEPVHQIGVRLKPSMYYGWTVRARFLLAGQLRVTDWLQFTLPSSARGEGTIRRDIDDEFYRYYHFITPSPLGYR